MVSFQRPALQLAVARIIQPHTTIGTRLDTKGQATLLLEVSQDPTTQSRLLPQETGLQEESKMGREAADPKIHMGADVEA